MTSSRDGKGLSWKIQSPRFASMRSSVVFTVDSENKRDDPRVHIFSVSDGRPRNDRPMDSVRSNHSHDRRLPQEVAPSSSSLTDELKEITFREFEVVFREVSVFVSPSSTGKVRHDFVTGGRDDLGSPHVGSYEDSTGSLQGRIDFLDRGAEQLPQQEACLARGTL